MRSLICLLLLATAAAAADILVLAPEEYHPALSDWKAHREKQGHTVRVAVPGDDPRATAKGLRTDDLRFILIVGDVKQVPAPFFPATIIKRWEKDPRVYSDNHVADFDGDHVPDVAIGRIPADNAEEAKTMLGKVIAYETNRDFSMWRRRVNVVAGVGGFGMAQDAAIEKASTMFLKENIPQSYDLHVTYAKLTSAFCPPPSQVQEVTTERLEEGSLFFAYIGHGWRQGFDQCEFQGKRYPIFTEDAAWELETRHGMPIAFLLCCSTGHFDGAPDCIAEVMVKRPKGPVAVISSSRVSMPYGNAIIAKELLEGFFLEHKATVGEAMLFAKHRAIHPKEGDKQRQLIQQLAWLAYEKDLEKLRQERIEHLYLYNLLGDPSMRIPHAPSLELAAPDEARAGARVTVTAPTKLAGRFTVELVEERNPKPAARKDDSEAAFQASYEKANAWVRASAEGEVKDGTLTAELELPKDLAPGRYDFRVWVEGDAGVAMGSRALAVAAPGAKQD